MRVVKGATADRGLQAVLTEMNKSGNYIETDSRNGPVRRIRGPATIMWTRPRYRVSFDPLRDANPAFHLFESMWMLSGQNDVKSPKYFASQMGQFSDDGVTFHGAYGYRWVQAAGVDQLRQYIIPALRENKEDRRAVLGMWDAKIDVPAAKAKGKDVPCNLIATFDAAMDDGRLYMSVFNRSNDLVWGATGANVVHFSILQEYVASACDLDVGVYEQISTNSHIYLELNEVSKRMLKTHEQDPTRDLPYLGKLSPLRHISDGTAEEWQDKFDSDIAVLMTNYNNLEGKTFQTRFFNEVVYPVIVAFNCYKNEDDLERGMHLLMSTLPVVDVAQPWYRWHDWTIAMYQWLDRRVQTRNENAKKAVSSGSIEDFTDSVKKVWKNAVFEDGEMKMGDTVVGTFEPNRKYVMFRGLHTDNLKRLDILKEQHE